ncbi:MAG TPA: YecA family protein [Pseudomonadales bacterium]|nr:YecA family protein [Pseudomonadales bacterium]
MTLSPQAIDTLEQYCFAQNEDAFGHAGAHGVVCANAVAMREHPMTECLNLICDKELEDSGQRAVALETLLSLQREIKSALAQGTLPALPFALNANNPEVEEWCAGFMSHVFLDESEWYQVDEEKAAELLLPIMVLSGLFDEPDIETIRKDKKLCHSFAKQLPDVLVDLYLLFRAPAEKE